MHRLARLAPRSLLLGILLLYAAAVCAQTASLVADLNTAVGTPTSVSQILLVPGKTFFTAAGDAAGQVPWVSDGTQAGTRMLTEACPDFCGDVIRMLGALGGVALWVSEDQGFWRSDGTRPGTYRLDGPAAGFSLTGEGVFLGGAYITRGCRGLNDCVLWRTDGTVAGTRAVESLPPGQSGQGAQSLTAAGSKVFFVRSAGAQEALWVSDGTAAGTRQLAVLPPSPGFPGAWVKGLTAVGDRVFFAASSNEDDEVWTSDGTPAGTHTVTHFPQASPFGALGESFTIQASGRRVYFLVENGPGAGLWRSDGTTQGTQQIATAVNTSFNQDFVEEVAGGRAIFRGYGGELWVTDGNPATAAPLQCGGPCPALASLISLHGFGQRAVFVTNFDEIWGTDGTAAGTHKVGSCTQFPCPFYQDLQQLSFYTRADPGRQSPLLPGWRGAVADRRHTGRRATDVRHLRVRRAHDRISGKALLHHQRRQRRIQSGCLEE
jgi:ELWxxDGT repeat protein